jgi:hypothetical protein
MNPQENRDYEQRLQELEAELDQDQTLPSVSNQAGQPLQPLIRQSQSEKSVLKQVTNWFNNLPSPGKVAVVVVTVLISFSVLRSVLQLVASLISLAILGAIVYLVYKFFVTPQSSK